jgi:hypothetical protein
MNSSLQDQRPWFGLINWRPWSNVDVLQNALPGISRWLLRQCEHAQCSKWTLVVRLARESLQS